MAAPTSSFGTRKRNPLNQISKFFRMRYQEDYVIFNLCKERDYDRLWFKFNVLTIPIEIRNPPTMKQILFFLDRADHFIQLGAKCIAIHSSEGKGRTGTLLSAWLLYTRVRKTATDAMHMFESARINAQSQVTSKGCQLLQPSQQRYVRYVERLIAAGGYHDTVLKLRHVCLKSCPIFEVEDSNKLYFIIEQNGSNVFDSRTSQVRMAGRAEIVSDCDQPKVKFSLDKQLCGDIKIFFLGRNDMLRLGSFCCSAITKEVLHFFFCFHTGFIGSDRLTLHRSDVEIASKDQFPADFSIELFFDTPEIPTEAEFYPLKPPNNPFLKPECQ